MDEINARGEMPITVRQVKYLNNVVAQGYRVIEGVAKPMLNLRIRNASVTELAFTPKRHMLVTYNTLPHLDGPEHADWITYS